MLHRALVLAASTLLVACGGGGGGGKAAPAANVTGNWAGSWVSSNGVNSGALTFDVFQGGPVVSGTGTMTNTACFGGVPLVDAVVNGTQMSGTVTQGTETLSFVVTIDTAASTFIGNYSVITSQLGCLGDVGALTASLVPSPAQPVTPAGHLEERAVLVVDGEVRAARVRRRAIDK